MSLAAKAAQLVKAAKEAPKKAVPATNKESNLTNAEEELCKKAKAYIEKCYSSFGTGSAFDNVIDQLRSAEQKSRLTCDTIGAPLYATAIIRGFLMFNHINGAVEEFLMLTKKRGQLNASIKSTMELLEETLIKLGHSLKDNDKLNNIADLMGMVTKATKGLIFVEDSHTRLSMAHIRLLCSLGRTRDAANIAEFLSSDTAASLPYAERMMYLCEQLKTIMDSGDMVKAYVMSDRVKEGPMFNVMLAEEGLIEKSDFIKKTAKDEEEKKDEIDNKNIVEIIAENNININQNNENEIEENTIEKLIKNEEIKEKVLSMRIIRRNYYKLAARMHLYDSRWLELAKVSWEYVATYYPVNTLITRSYFAEHGTTSKWVDLSTITKEENYECAMFASTAIIALSMTDITTNKESQLLLQLMIRSSMYTYGGEVRRDFRPMARLINPFAKKVASIWITSSLSVWNNQLKNIVTYADKYIPMEHASENIDEKLKSYDIPVFSAGSIIPFAPVPIFSSNSNIRQFITPKEININEEENDKNRKLIIKKINETWILFKERLIEKNMIIVCKNFSFTKVKRIAELLNITESEAENALVKINEQFFVLIDSPKDEVQFLKERNGEDVLIDWFLEIGEAVKNINNVVNLIELEKQQ